jgi:glycosyltransferase involved in cell wall biosynthesis
VKVLIVTLYFPPAGGGGVQRPLKFATHLPALGIETHVLAPDNPKWIHMDEELRPPTQAWVHRVRYLGPKGRRPSEELHGKRGLERALTHARLLPRRLVVPDEAATWNLTAIPAALRIARAENIDVVITTSPPGSVHLVGAAVKRALGVHWIADLRDSLLAHQDRRADTAAVRMKARTVRVVAGVVARRADAIVTAFDSIGDEMRALSPLGRIVTIANGSDFDDFEGMAYTPGERFRITHTGAFFGQRDPKPFLRALADSGLDDVVARFVGGFRAADQEFAESLGLADRIEAIPFVPRRRSLELQRDSEALLLILPEAGGRGTGVIPGKVFEYVAAGRPILAAVPPGGAAAKLIDEIGAGIVAPVDDVEALRGALIELHALWQRGELAVTLAPDARERLSRRARVAELAALVREVAGEPG